MSVESFHDGRVVLHKGDCLAALRTMPSNSIDAAVMDPPYGIAFMGKKWDVSGPEQRAFAVEFWREVFRVLKPGGHVLAFSATRTVHRMTCAIEDAGFEIRDMIAWMYGSGFPKSHDVARAIDAADALAPRRERALKFTSWMRSTGISATTIAGLTGSSMASHYLTAGAQPEVATAAMFDLLRPALPPVPEEIEALVAARTVESENLKRREVVGHHADQAQAARWREDYQGSTAAEAKPITRAYTEAAQAWEGWGTALKPALEPVTVARKPLQGTVAENVLAYGTGALNIDACRVEMSDADRAVINTMGGFGKAGWSTDARVALSGTLDHKTEDGKAHDLGRWPANVVIDGSGEVVDAFPETGKPNASRSRRPGQPYVPNGQNEVYGAGMGGGYHPGFDDVSGSAARFFFSAKADGDDRIGSKHPTVKPVDLMRWCVRLVTPPGGTVLDCFAGTGTTGEAAFREGMRAVLCEREPEYQADIARRMALILAGPALRKAASAKARDRKPKPSPLFGED